MAVQQNIPGDVTIKTVSMFTDRGVLNMVEHVHGMSIYESIFNPGVIAELTVYDTRNIASLLPISGGERLVIELATPGRKDLKYEMVITAFKEGIVSQNARQKAYVLMATTVETVRNKANQVTKAYNTNISNMVSDILKSYLGTSKKLDIQPTRGIQKLIIPSIQPFDALKMLRKRAVSIEDKSSAYVFFENQDGFHFKTIEKLMSQTSVGDRVFFNDPNMQTDITRSAFRNVICYEQPQQFEVIDRLDQGGLAYEIKKFDYKTLEYKRTVTKFDASELKSADGTVKDTDKNELKRLAKKPGSNVWVAHDSGNPDTWLSEGLRGHASGGTLYGQGSLMAQVFGDSELTAGQLIEMQLVENSGATQAPGDHPQISGKYVIAFLHHIIAAEGDNPRYTCSFEAIKGGLKQ